jgi:hypothetical protein
MSSGVFAVSGMARFELASEGVASSCSAVELQPVHVFVEPVVEPDILPFAARLRLVFGQWLDLPGVNYLAGARTSLTRMLGVVVGKRF